MQKAIQRACYILDIRCNEESILRESHGNLHKAMNLLLLNKGNSKICIEKESDDYEFQFFHSLGKFLYNKSK